MFNDSVKLPLESPAITGRISRKHKLTNPIMPGVWTVRLIGDRLILITPMKQVSKKEICVLGKGIVTEALMVTQIKRAFRVRDEVLLFINVPFPKDPEDIPPKLPWWKKIFSITL